MSRLMSTESLIGWKAPDRLLRMMADGLVFNVALIVGTGLDYSIRVMFDPSVTQYPELLRKSVIAYLLGSLVMTAAALTVFAVSGLYTRTRAYRGRLKFASVAYAVAAVFLGLISISFLVWDLIPFLSPLTLAIAGVVCAIGMVGTRFWSYLWERALRDQLTDPGVVPEHVLVIGGGGYIGSALIPKLLAEGMKVRLLDSFVYGRQAISSFANNPKLEVIAADFRRLDALVNAMRDVDAVVHLGAIVGDPACELDSEATVEVNLVATRTIAELAKAHRVHRFVFASTCSVYGASDELLDEQSELSPVSLYARTKIASEQVLEELTDSTFRPTILRFGTVYGLSGRTRFDLVVNLLSAKAVTDGKITVFGESQWRPFVHVADAAKSIQLALGADLRKVGGETFSVGSDEQNQTLGDIGRLIHSLRPDADLLMMDADGDRRNYRVDFAKIRDQLRFRPDWTLEGGVRQVMATFDDGEIADYTHADYSNVKFLSSPEGVDVLRSERAWLTQLVDIRDQGPTVPSQSQPQENIVLPADS